MSAKCQTLYFFQGHLCQATDPIASVMENGRYIARPIRTPRPATGAKPRRAPILPPKTYLSIGMLPVLSLQ